MNAAMLPSLDRRLRAYALACFVFAAWTVVIKYINPLAWSWGVWRLSGIFPPPAVLLDFWPVLHVWMGVWLWTRHRRAWHLALTVSAVEIIVIVTKFVLWYLNPLDPLAPAAPPVVDAFMRGSWFINKCALLVFFAVVLADLARPGTRQRMAAEGAA